MVAELVNVFSCFQYCPVVFALGILAPVIFWGCVGRLL